MLFKMITRIVAVMVLVPVTVPMAKAMHHIQTLALSHPSPVLRFREWEELLSQHQLQYKAKSLALKIAICICSKTPRSSYSPKQHQMANCYLITAFVRSEGTDLIALTVFLILTNSSPLVTTPFELYRCSIRIPGCKRSRRKQAHAARSSWMRSSSMTLNLWNAGC